MRPTSITIEKLNKIYLSDIQPHVSESTFMSYRSCANSINRALGHLKAAEVSTADLEDYLNSYLLGHDGQNGGVEYKRKTRLNHASYLRLAFTFLFKKGKLKSNPCLIPLDVKGKDDIEHVEPYSEDEINEIKRLSRSSNILKSHMALILLFAISAGMRPSELVALLLDDVKAGKLPQTYDLDINKARAIRATSDTKNQSSNRTIALSSASISFLNQILKRTDTSVNEVVESSSSEQALIINPLTNQGFINPKELYNLSKSVFKEEKGFRFRGIQPTRHTFATVCVDNQISFEETASMMGHTDTKMIRNHYAYHRKIVEGEGIRNKLNRMFQN